MIKVYTHMEFTHVGHYQSILEENDIETTVKNKASSIGMGQLADIETWPELWILNDSDEEKAREILKDVSSEIQTKTKAWTCPKCNSDVDEGYSECWNCGEVLAN